MNNKIFSIKSTDKKYTEHEINIINSTYDSLVNTIKKYLAHTNHALLFSDKNSSIIDDRITVKVGGLTNYDNHMIDNIIKELGIEVTVHSQTLPNLEYTQFFTVQINTVLTRLKKQKKRRKITFCTLFMVLLILMLSIIWMSIRWERKIEYLYENFPTLRKYTEIFKNKF